MMLGKIIINVKSSELKLDSGFNQGFKDFTSLFLVSPIMLDRKYKTIALSIRIKENPKMKMSDQIMSSFTKETATYAICKLKFAPEKNSIQKET
jgi:hypothetical protein